ncbi:MAG TPA: tetratricopeptide repeat protein [Bryobacteraceae bacterium]
MKGFFLIFGIASVLVAESPELERARNLYDLTAFDQSLRVLEAIPAKNAAVYDLMGRDYYMLGDYKRSTEAIEKALFAEPSVAVHALWLGRAYGRRAESASWFTAPGYASKARQYLERAVELDPRNLDALADLFDYYLEAPGFLGGGEEKAQRTAATIERLSPADGYLAEAKLAEKRKEYSTCEAHLRAAVEAAPQQVGKLIELARFLVKEGRVEEADQSLARAEKIAPGNPRLMFAKADLYIQTGRKRQAREILQHYLSGRLTPDDPPRSEALRLLRQAGS